MSESEWGGREKFIFLTVVPKQLTQVQPVRPVAPAGQTGPTELRHNDFDL